MLYRSTCTILAIFYCFKKLQLVGEFLLPMLQYPIQCKRRRGTHKFFPLKYDRMGQDDFSLTLDQGKTYMNSHNMIDIWEKLQLTISPLYGYIVHGEGRVQHQLYLPQLTINFCIYMFTSVLRSNKNVCYTTFFHKSLFVVANI